MKYQVAYYYEPFKRNLRVEVTRDHDGKVVVNMAHDLADDEGVETAINKVFAVFVKHGMLEAERVPELSAAAMENFRSTVAG